MERLDFTLTLTSPAFFAGAGGRRDDSLPAHLNNHPRRYPIGPDKDGLRVPSLRGVLRFWWRAKEGISDPAELARREAELFGSTGRGQGLRIVPRGTSEWTAEEWTAAAGSAQSYLGYGPLNYRPDLRTTSSQNKFAARWAAPADSWFSFRAIGSPAQIEELRRTLVLLHLFGGVGARSRRGWGSVAVEMDGLDLQKGRSELPEIWVERLLRTVWPPDGAVPEERASAPPYSAFHRGTQIRFFTCDGTFGEVFERFFERFKAVRVWNRRDPSASPPTALADKNGAGATLAGSALYEAPRRVAYGLPYRIAINGSGGGEVDYFGKRANDTEFTRRSSPLILKVARVDGGTLAGMVLFFNTPFAGAASGTIEAKDLTGSHPFPGYGAVREFLDHDSPRSRPRALQPRASRRRSSVRLPARRYRPGQRPRPSPIATPAPAARSTGWSGLDFTGNTP